MGKASAGEKTVFFHLGLPKCASTYLQSVIFPRLKGLRFFPKKYFKKHRELIEKTDDERYLFSEEMYSNLEERVAAIASQYPNAGAIFVLKRHDRWLTSRYKYYLKKKGYLHFREYFDLYKNTGWVKKESLYFQNKLDSLQKSFSKKPLILFNEDLSNDPDAFFQKLLAYTGTDMDTKSLKRVKVKQSFNEKQLILLRKFNRAFPYRKPEKLPKSLKKLKQNLREGLNYGVTTIALLMPRSWVGKEPLIPEDDLKAIKDYYQADWEYCKAFAEEVNTKDRG